MEVEAQGATLLLSLLALVKVTWSGHVSGDFVFGTRRRCGN